MRPLNFTLLSAITTLSLLGCQPKGESAPPAMDSPIAAKMAPLKADPAIHYGQLQNGMRYAFLHNDTPTKTAAIRLYIGAGSLDEHDDIQGLAHFLEHMAFNGSENIPEGEMIKILERYGLAFGADTNAYTSFDETVYMLDLPEVSEEMFDVTLNIMRETASRLTLEQDAINRERGVIQSEKRRRDSPSYRAQMDNLDFLLGESRIPSRLPIGDDADLLSMDAPDFEAFYKGYYRPEKAFLVIVGDSDPEFVASKIDEYFSDWSGEGEPLENKTAGAVGKRGLEIGYFTDPDIQTSISLGVMRPYIDQEDTALNRRNKLVDGLGNRILNRRFASLARSENAKFISAGASTTDLYEAAEMSSISVSSQPELWPEALAVAEQELRRAIQYGFTQAELDEQLANLRKSLEVAVQTAETRRTSSLAMGLVNAHANETVFTTPQSSLDRYLSYEESITTQEVWTRFKRQWEGNEKPLIYLMTSEILAQPEDTILDAFQQSQAIEVGPPQISETVDFAYTDFGTPGDIADRGLIEPEDIHTIRFSNNVRVNLKQTDFDKDSIRIAVQFGGGFLSLPEDNPNVQHFASYVMNSGGLEAHSSDELQRILAGKAVAVNFNMATKHFSLSGSTVPEDLPLQLNLMMAQFIAPGYRPEAKARYDKQVESWYPTLDSTPGGVAARDMGRLIHNGDLRFGYPTQSEFLAVTADQVKSWLTPHFASSPIEISIVGDFDIDKVITELARTFGTLPKRPLTLQNDYSAATKLTFPQGRRTPVKLSHTGEANRSMLSIYWPSPDGSDRLRARRIGMLEQIFSNRLTEVIREEQGAAYSPSAFSYAPETFKDYGYMGVSLDLDPADVDRMSKIVDGIAAEFAKGNFSEDEFNRAMQPVLENIETSLENNGYWMGVVNEAQSRPDYIEDHRNRLETYENMTASDLRPLAAQIFNPNSAYRVQILPQG